MLIITGKFDSVWVSTDHDGIAECAAMCGAKVFRRGAENAADTATSISAVQEFLEQHPEVDILGLIQVSLQRRDCRDFNFPFITVYIPFYTTRLPRGWIQDGAGGIRLCVQCY